MAARIRLLPGLGAADFLALTADADVMLDPFFSSPPPGGGATFSASTVTVFGVVGLPDSRIGLSLSSNAWT